MKTATAILLAVTFTADGVQLMQTDDGEPRYALSRDEVRTLTDTITTQAEELHVLRKMLRCPEDEQ